MRERERRRGLRLTAGVRYSRISSMRRFLSKVLVNRASVLGVVCISLVLVSGMAQAAHFHTGAPDHDCALCVAAHSVAHASIAITLHLCSLQIAPVSAARSLTMPRRAVFFRLASRPPPVGFAPLA